MMIKQGKIAGHLHCARSFKPKHPELVRVDQTAGKVRLVEFDRRPRAESECLGGPSGLHQGVAPVVIHLENLAATPSLDHLANLAHSNPSFLNHPSKERSGMTVFQWLREQRLIQAVRLPCTTDLSVGEIASRVGLTSHQGLSKAFHQRFDLNPVGYRGAKRD